MTNKYKYEFYYRISRAASIDKGSNKEGNKDSYVQMEFERNLPLSDEEYEIASKKLIDSVVNDMEVEKKYISPITKKEYIENAKDKYKN